MRVSVATPASRSPCRLKIPSSDEAAPMSFIAVSLWGAFMMAAIFYTQEARHPATKPLVAYMIFTTTFSLTALVLFGGLFLLLQRLNLTESLEHPLAAAAFLATVFLPADRKSTRLNSSHKCATR